jgi:hypothetical protein
MDKENTETLIRDFPILYRGHKDSPSKSLMCFGFECGDGWFQLIYDLSKQISEICPRVKAMQVKEKFGTLRFYVENVQSDKADLIYGVIEKAEVKSGIICELCGDDKTPTRKTSKGSNWIRTLCEECRRKDEEQREKG